MVNRVNQELLVCVAFVEFEEQREALDPVVQVGVLVDKVQKEMQAIQVQQEQLVRPV